MRRPKPRTKDQIIVALKAAARKLGHAPTSTELTRLSGITINQVRERFSGYRLAVCAAGLKPSPMGVRVETAALLQDWAKAVRAVGGVPSRREYERLGSYGGEILSGRFQGWSQVPSAFSRLVDVVTTLCRLGLGLGGPWVAQAWPKGHPSVTQGSPKGGIEEVLLFQRKCKMPGWC